jgi:hypothetical protein
MEETTDNTGLPTIKQCCDCGQDFQGWHGHSQMRCLVCRNGPASDERWKREQPELEALQNWIGIPAGGAVQRYISPVLVKKGIPPGYLREAAFLPVVDSNSNFPWGETWVDEIPGQDYPVMVLRYRVWKPGHYAFAETLYAPGWGKEFRIRGIYYKDDPKYVQELLKAFMVFQKDINRKRRPKGPDDRYAFAEKEKYTSAYEELKPEFGDDRPGLNGALADRLFVDVRTIYRYQRRYGWPQ